MVGAKRNTYAKVIAAAGVVDASREAFSEAIDFVAVAGGKLYACHGERACGRYH